MKDNFKEQLKEFISDTSYKEKYSSVDINDNHYLIEIFKFKTKEQSLFSFEGAPSEILLIDQLSGDIKKASDIYVDYTHVAKILKAPKGDVKYKEGDCVLLNPFDIVGKAKNPEFALYEQFQHSLGYTPVIPENLQENIPAIQARYLEYQFVLPEDYNIGTQNIVTFLVPEFKIKAKYNV